MRSTQRCAPHARVRAAAAAPASSALSTACGSGIACAPHAQAADTAVRIDIEPHVRDGCVRLEAVEEVALVGRERHGLEPAHPAAARDELGDARASGVDRVDGAAVGVIALEMV